MLNKITFTSAAIVVTLFLLWSDLVVMDFLNSNKETMYWPTFVTLGFASLYALLAIVGGGAWIVVAIWQKR